MIDIVSVATRIFGFIVRFIFIVTGVNALTKSRVDGFIRVQKSISCV
jgi:hypothetical protein